MGSDRQRDPAGTAANDKGIGDDPSRRQGGHSEFPSRRHTGVALEPLPWSCIVEEVEGGGQEDPAWVDFFIDGAGSVEVQWEADGGGA